MKKETLLFLETMKLQLDLMILLQNFTGERTSSVIHASSSSSFRKVLVAVIIDDLGLWVVGGILSKVGSFGRRGNMEENAGLFKVIIVQGRNLAIRDFTRSSDPYVVVRVGNQTAKTKVINSCLNPVWNEELTFSMKEPLGVLKLEVFDRDRFKSDDEMGHAFLDLQPMVSASKLKRALQLTTGETTLRKVAPNIDNCLLADSFVTHMNGEIVLDVYLKLRDVESGELHVTVKWIDHHPPTTSVDKTR